MLSIKNLSVRIAGRLLIENADLSLPDGAKAGIVGRNGSGKTTLFRTICGEHESESGSIEIPKSWRIGQVAQEAPGTADSLISIVLAADTERESLLNEKPQTEDPNRIAEIEERLQSIDAHSAEARAAAILAGLGFSEPQQQQPAYSFSGGWRMRVALAAVLFSRPDLLLLDEPTNYLDLEGTLWLENYLARVPSTVLIISHDRDLLNRSASSIIHLEHKRLKLYRGNYDSFDRQHSEQKELDAKMHAKLESRAKHMQSFVDRFRYKASKAKQAQSRIKAIEKLKPPELLEEAGVTPIQFPNPGRKLASPIIRLEDVSCSYEPDMPILNQMNLNIDSNDRIALLGSNGNGKSTFAKLLCGRMKHVTGQIVTPSKLSIAMFAQHQLDDLNEEETPVDHIRPLMANVAEARIRSRVAQMGLDRERMDTKARDLSGGEKARLLLGIACFNAPDLLILDEPTNHLDVGARESLAHALNEFQGAVILISHDRHLIDATMNRLWIVRDGGVNSYEGDLETYKKDVLSSKGAKNGRLDNTGSTKNNSKKNNRVIAAEQRKQLVQIRKLISQKESEISDIEDTLAKIDLTLSKDGYFEREPERAVVLSKKRAGLQQSLNEAEAQWVELSEKTENH